MATKRIVFLSHTAPSAVFKVGSHHLSRELSHLGHAVAHVAGPISAAHVIRLRQAVVRSRFRAVLTGGYVDGAGVFQSVPFTIVPLSRLSEAGRRRQLTLPAPWRRRFMRGWSRPDVVFVDQPLLAPLARELHPDLIVYRPTDAHFDPVVREAEIALLEDVDAIVATSRSVLEQVIEGTSSHVPSMVLENGVEYERFARSARTDAARSGLIYVGAIDHRFDWNVVSRIAVDHPSELVRIVGPVAARQPAQLPSNVSVLGAVPYERVPELLHISRVGLLPLSSDPGNAGRSPMKFYEYLAAGLQVVARRSPALEVRMAPGVRLYDAEAGASAQVGEALRDLENLDGAEFARAYGWRARSQELLDFTEGLR